MTLNFSLSNGKSVPREQFVILLRTALALEENRFARQTALVWLAHYPGDLQVNLLYGQSLLSAGMTEQAMPILEKVCRCDPEFLQGQTQLHRARKVIGEPDCFKSAGELYVLGGDPEQQDLPEWAYQLRKARIALEGERASEAEDLVHQVLASDRPSPLAGLFHLKVNSQKDLPWLAMRDLAGHYHAIWPDCLAFTLWIAAAFMESEKTDKAVALLHKVAAGDVAGQVVTRMWGADHPYRSLWPLRMAAPLEIAIPAALAAALGWNQLPSPAQDNRQNMTQEGGNGLNVAQADQIAETRIHRPVLVKPEIETSMGWGGKGNLPAQELKTGRRRMPSPTNTAVPETLRDVQDELERVAGQLKREYIAQSDGRFPVYVVFTTRAGLRGKYGSRSAEIDLELKRLVAAVGRRNDWRALLLYADDAKSASHYGIAPAKADDAWELKLALADLDIALGKQGEMIGAVLIVGGPEVVPFHYLPNPVDDADDDAPSDNPYATRDENYFIPEWPVGRLPGGAQPDAEPLLCTIRGIIERHSRMTVRSQAPPFFSRWLHGLLERLWFLPRRERPSWGYTAAVWRQAAVSVFRPIGPPHSMLVSPPAQVDGQPGRIQKNKLLPKGRLGYFNLHGVVDANEWYGQRDPADGDSQTDYPIALRPQDVINGGRAPQVVFTEACYGAHIIGKKAEEALALKFLASGSQAVVGSTVTAYGSITPPLIAADLLGHTFWRYLREGLPAGEALRRAKIHLAREMLNRQGYLDGEDQKTLITFVYYGDPLAQAGVSGPRAKTIYRPIKRPKAIQTVCDRVVSKHKSPTLETLTPIPAETLTAVKRIVEQYLPGMQDAEVLFAQEHGFCRGDNHTCPTSQLGVRPKPADRPRRSVVTLSKQIQTALHSTGRPADLGTTAEAGSGQVHWHYARLTLDQDGKIVKMAVSR